MRFSQLAFDKIETSGHILRTLSPTIIEAGEHDSLARDIFDIYKTKINKSAQKLGPSTLETNAYTYPIICDSTRPSLLHFVFYTLESTGISIEAQNNKEAQKFYRIFREQRAIYEDIDYVRKSVKGSLNEIIAALLWQIGAIKVSLGDLEPLFKVDERRNYSPIYIDVKCLSRYNRYNDFIVSVAATIASKLDFDIICSIEAGGIAFGTLLGDRLNKPSFFARRRKKYPEASLLEIMGHEIHSKKVLIVDDTIVKGWTKERLINEIREKGGLVNDCLVIFDRQQGARKPLSSVGVRLHYLTNREACLSEAIPDSITYLTKKEYREIRTYFKSPKAWHKKHGFPYHELKKNSQIAN